MHASYAPPNGAAGGSGVVIVKEAGVSSQTSNCWDLRTVFRASAAGNWS